MANWQFQEPRWQLKQQEEKLHTVEDQLREQRRHCSEQEVKIKDHERKLRDLEVRINENHLKLQGQLQNLVEHEEIFRYELSKIQSRVSMDMGLQGDVGRLQQKAESQHSQSIAKEGTGDENKKKITSHEAKFLLTNFNDLFSNNLEWKSPSTYTHERGYKFCVGVKANVSVSASRQAVAINLYTMPGEYDGELKWPAQASFTVELVNKVGGDNMAFVSSKNGWSRPMDLFKSMQFLSVGNLGQTNIFVECYKLGDFLLDNTLEIIVTNKFVLH